MIDPALLQLDLFQLWDSFYVMTVLVIGTIAGLSMVSKSLAIASYVGFLVFARIATSTGDSFLINVLYISVVIIVIGMAFKIGRAEFGFIGGT